MTIFDKSDTSLGKVTHSNVKSWRSEPHDFTYACQAAFHYAKKWDMDMVIVPGNSYMKKVYHIARITDDILKFPGAKGQKCAVVGTDGYVYMCRAK